MRALEYGRKVCDAMMHRYQAAELPPKGVLFYHQGVFLSGVQEIYKLCCDKKYFRYVKEYVDSIIGPNGELAGFDHEYKTPDTPDMQKIALTTLDARQPVILLYQLYEETGEEKYRKVIEKITKSMYYYPVNLEGGYWHKISQPYQMWMDGAYMVAPLSLMYDAAFGDEVLRERAINQIFIMDKYLKDSKTGLYYHGWDESKKASWANPDTGLSGQFWGRAVGWFAVAIVQVLEYLPKEHPSVERLKKIETELLHTLAKYQDVESGMWYEVLDQTDREDNWVESSCTNLFIYAYARAIRTGIIGEEYEDVLLRAYKGIEDILYYDEEGYIVIDKVCIGTNIDSGTYEHYIGRKQVKNDLHGVGAFLLMCSEMEKYQRWKVRQR